MRALHGRSLPALVALTVALGAARAQAGVEFEATGSFTTVGSIGLGVGLRYQLPLSPAFRANGQAAIHAMFVNSPRAFGSRVWGDVWQLVPLTVGVEYGPSGHDADADDDDSAFGWFVGADAGATLMIGQDVATVSSLVPDETAVDLRPSLYLRAGIEIGSFRIGVSVGAPNVLIPGQLFLGAVVSLRF